MRMTEALRQLIEDGQPTLVLPGAYDAMSAKVFERVGFPGVYMTGYGTAASLGFPDAGLITMTEMVSNAKYIADAVGVPVVTDADTGYGNAVNVRRTVREYIAAGVAGIHIEDQVAPKRCGHVAGKRVISVDEAAGKIRAACATRDEMDPAFVIIARTDARGSVDGSVQEAIARGNEYASAGADLVFFEAPLSEAEVERAAREISAPLVVLCGGISPFIPLNRLNELNVRITLLASLGFKTVGKALYDAGRHVMRKGIDGYREVLEGANSHELSDFNTFIGFDQVHADEEAFIPNDGSDRYGQSKGYVPGTKSN